MAEDQFLATREGRFRGSRYPGFVGGTVSPSTGLGTTTGTSSSSAGLFGGSNNTSLAAQAFDIPEVQTPSLGAMAKDLGGMAAGAGATYAATKVGEGAGSAIASGASLGEGIRAGVSGFASDTANALGFGAGQKVYDSVASVGPTMAEFTGGSGAGGEALGSVAGGSSSQGTSLAAQSFGDRLGEGLTSGANIGAGLGAGLASTVIGLATGQKPKDALLGGAATGIGTYLGTAVGGPVGGFVGGVIGSTVGSIFCYAAGTLIRMTDGTVKLVEELRIGDEVLAGGQVIGRGEVLCGEVYRYRGEVVNGAHAAFEGGRWLRVRDSELAEPVVIEVPVIVHPVVTLNHLMVTASGIISADFAELDDAYHMNDSERLAAMNDDIYRIQQLMAFEGELRQTA